ncbi:MAG: hypothetical protein WA020_09085 [Candidatus Acidiferrales bacterium]
MTISNLERDFAELGAGFEARVGGARRRDSESRAGRSKQRPCEDNGKGWRRKACLRQAGRRYEKP